jgi:hypothetical protein
MEQISQNIIDATDALDLQLDETERAALLAQLAANNERASIRYRDCREQVTAPFLMP